MKSSTVDTVTGWDSGPFTDGHAGLRDLADREFTGAVTNGSAWLFMLNGRVIGVFDGDIDSFADASGTRYEAPHASLPLLYTMQETGGETRAKYYSEKTPLSEVDGTLKGGKFTGYVELSENVLSGDYYTVYQGGKSMSVAFVGNKRRMLTGDEAFQRADDEVGIYEVRTVDIDVVDIPAPEPASSEDESSSTGAAGAGAGAAAGAAGIGADADDGDATDDATPDAKQNQGGVTFGDGDDPLADDPSPSEPADTPANSDSSAAGPVGGSDGERADAASESSTDDRTPNRSAGGEDPLADDDPVANDDPIAADDDPVANDDPIAADDGPLADDTRPVEERPTTDRPTEDPAADRKPDVQSPAGGETTRPKGQAEQRDQAAQRDEPAGPHESTSTEHANADRTRHETSGASAEPSAFDDEASWRESRTIPALDPEETSVQENANANGAAGAASRNAQGNSQSRKVQRDGQRTESRDAPGQGGRRQSRQRLQNAEAAVEELRTERDRLAARVEELEAERERRSEADAEHEQELQRLRQERDEATEQVANLESTVAELEATVETLEGQLAEARADEADTASKQSVSPDRAFRGTNLFVRYSRKSGATLDDAFDGTASREEVNENLRLEHHTDFDADETVVEELPFDDWLESTVEYGFSRWLVTEFIHDVRETRNQSSLEALYQAIPEVDRIEFQGTVDVPTAEGGTENLTFDVVLRDRMGDPLVVANLNDSREPATESMVDSLVESAAPVGEAEPALAGAFFVTTSYFEPGALETAHDATGGGLLRRERRKSFVKLSRKDGYHLCLVETRNGEFHVNVPEL